LQQMQSGQMDMPTMMQQFQTLRQQFQQDTANMDPAQQAQLQQQMMQQMMPMIQQAMPTLINQGMKMQMDSLKADLECTDEEFAAMQPLIQNIMSAQIATRAAGVGAAYGRGGGGGGFAGGRGFGGGGIGGLPGANSPSAVDMQKAQSDLSATLDDPNASNDLISTKLNIFRVARAKARQEMADTQTQLKSLLTQKQEAILVIRGILD
jgi:hypothetical protein